VHRERKRRRGDRSVTHVGVPGQPSKATFVIAAKAIVQISLKRDGKCGKNQKKFKGGRRKEKHFWC
jgi:hypothetical protein